MANEIVLAELTNIIPAGYADRETFFLNENNEVQPVIEKVRAHYLTIAIDSSTPEGLKAIKKLGAELNKVKAQIDEYGKEVVDILKAKPRKIDAGRKVIKDALDDAYSTIMKPVHEYDAEQRRIKAEAEAKAAEEQRLKDAELAQLRAEKEQLDREAQIREKAAAQAALEAEKKIRDAELALQREREKTKREAELKAQREQDEKHRRSVKNQAYHALVANHIDATTAKTIIMLIDENKIENIKIMY